MKFLKNWLWSGSAESLSRIGTLSTFLAYFPLIGNEGAGFVLASYAYAMTAWLFIDLGLGFYGVRTVAEGKVNLLRLQCEITLARLLIATLLAPVTIVLMVVLAKAPLVMSLGFGVFLITRAMAVDWRLRGEARFKDLAIISGISSAIQLTSILFVNEENWSSFGSLPWVAWSMVYVLGGWAITSTSSKKVLWPGVYPSLINIKKSLGFTFTNGAGVVFGQMPIILLSFSMVPAQYAGFALLHRLVLSTNLVFQTMGIALFPKVVRAAKNGILSAWNVTKELILPTIFASFLIVFIFCLFFLVSREKFSYFDGVEFFVFLAMMAFLILRGIRENIVRLALASHKESISSAIVVTVVILYFFTSVAWSFFQTIDILFVSFSFLFFELIIFISLVLAMYKVIKGRS